MKECVGGGELQAMVEGDRQAGRQSCHEIESERNQEEAWLYGVPQCETCRPQGPTQRGTRQTQHRNTLNLAALTEVRKLKV